MNKTRVFILLALTLAITTLFTSVALGARSYRSNYRGYRSGRSGYSALSSAYASLIRANAIQIAATRAAQAESYRSHLALYSTRARMEHEFDFSPQASEAQATLLRTSRELDAARQAVHERLSRDQDLQAAIAAKDRAAADRILSAAFKADADVQAALESYQHATSTLNSLKHEFEGGVTRDPQWIAARAKLENARVKVAQSYAAGNQYLSGGNRSPYYPARYGVGYPRR